MELHPDRPAALQDWSPEPDQISHSNQIPKPKVKDRSSRNAFVDGLKKPQTIFGIQQDDDKLVVTGMSDLGRDTSTDAPKTPGDHTNEDEDFEQHSQPASQPADVHEDEYPRERPQREPQPSAPNRVQLDQHELCADKSLTLVTILLAALYSSFSLALTLNPSMTDRLLAIVMIMLWRVLFSDTWRAINNSFNN